MDKNRTKKQFIAETNSNLTKEIGIEHAFNCINGVYVDITDELVLGYDVTKEDYLSIIEISDEKVLEYCRKFEAYMSLVPYEIGKECGLGEEVEHF